MRKPRITKNPAAVGTSFPNVPVAAGFSVMKMVAEKGRHVSAPSLRGVFFRQRRKIRGTGAFKGRKAGGIVVIIEAGQIGPGTAQRVDQHGGSLLSQVWTSTV